MNRLALRLGLAVAVLLAPLLDGPGPADDAPRESLAQLAQSRTRGAAAPVALRSPRATTWMGASSSRGTRLLHDPLGGTLPASAAAAGLDDRGSCPPCAEVQARAAAVPSLPPRAPPLPAWLLA
jgi:hypothetical protein